MAKFWRLDNGESHQVINVDHIIAAHWVESDESIALWVAHGSGAISQGGAGAMIDSEADLIFTDAQALELRRLLFDAS